MLSSKRVNCFPFITDVNRLTTHKTNDYKTIMSVMDWLSFTRINKNYRRLPIWLDYFNFVLSFTDRMSKTSFDKILLFYTILIRRFGRSYHGWVTPRNFTLIPGFIREYHYRNSLRWLIWWFTPVCLIFWPLLVLERFDD